MRTLEKTLGILVRSVIAFFFLVGYLLYKSLDLLVTGAYRFIKYIGISINNYVIKNDMELSDFIINIFIQIVCVLFGILIGYNLMLYWS